MSDQQQVAWKEFVLLHLDDVANMDILCTASNKTCLAEYLNVPIVLLPVALMPLQIFNKVFDHADSYDDE